MVGIYAPCNCVIYLKESVTGSVKVTSGLYYKTITIVLMMIVSDATIWSVTYDCN
jgi:hypothetical protein